MKCHSVQQLFSTIIEHFSKNGNKFITDFKTEPDEIDSDESLPDIPPPLDTEPKPQAKDDKKFTPSPLKKPTRYTVSIEYLICTSCFTPHCIIFYLRHETFMYI